MTIHCMRNLKIAIQFIASLRTTLDFHICVQISNKNVLKHFIFKVRLEQHYKYAESHLYSLATKVFT